MSIRLLVVVEGYTEEGFVNRVLGPHLWNFGVFAEAKLVATKYRQGQVVGKGGGRHYKRWKEDFVRLRSQDCGSDRWFTSMFDYYGLAKLEDEFPGYKESRAKADPYERITVIEEAFAQDIGSHHFVPYMQLHEYEALLFADPGKLDAEYLDHEIQIARLVALADSVSSPELINEGEDTAPSKRIIAEIPAYESNKPRVGTLVAEKIGLPMLRARCKHFDGWVRRLESLGAGA